MRGGSLVRGVRLRVGSLLGCFGGYRVGSIARPASRPFVRGRSDTGGSPKAKPAAWGAGRGPNRYYGTVTVGSDRHNEEAAGARLRIAECGMALPIRDRERHLYHLVLDMRHT